MKRFISSFDWHCHKHVSCAAKSQTAQFPFVCSLLWTQSYESVLFPVELCYNIQLCSCFLFSIMGSDVMRLYFVCWYLNMGMYKTSMSPSLPAMMDGALVTCVNLVTLGLLFLMHFWLTSLLQLWIHFCAMLILCDHIMNQIVQYLQIYQNRNANIFPLWCGMERVCLIIPWHCWVGLTVPCGYTYKNCLCLEENFEFYDLSGKNGSGSGFSQAPHSLNPPPPPNCCRNHQMRPVNMERVRIQRNRISFRLH